MRRRHDRQSLLARDVLIINSRRRTFTRSRSSSLSFTRERRLILSRVLFRLLYGSKCVVRVAGCTCTYPRTIIILSQSWRLHRRRWWIRFLLLCFLFLFDSLVDIYNVQRIRSRQEFSFPFVSPLQISFNRSLGNNLIIYPRATKNPADLWGCGYPFFKSEAHTSIYFLYWFIWFFLFGKY